jgi:aspartate aminotransferase
MIGPSKTIEKIPHSPTLWANDLVWEKRSKGEEVYHMGFGESPFPVPERLERALADATHRKEYIQASGLPELHGTIRDYYRPLVGVYVDGCDLLTAPGSKLILYAVQSAVEGDLLLPVPSWVSYAPQAMMIGTDVVKVQTMLDDAGYHLSAGDIKEAIVRARRDGKNPTKLILNYPNNPTGLTIPDAELREIAEVCIDEEILIISDEIYGLVSFEGEYSSISKYAPENTVISTGLSKHLSLGGWRYGVGFIPREIDWLHGALCRFVSETWSCVSSPVQVAVKEAYRRHDDVEKHIEDCTAIHELMNKYISQGLKDCGIICGMAQGAFYNYPDFEPFREGMAKIGITTSQKLHEYLLKEYSLATLPGSAFGEDESVLTLRLSGCDYDGEAALKAYQGGEDLDNGFVAKYAPHIVKQVEIFVELVESLK